MRRTGLPEWKLRAACRGEPVELFYNDAYADVARTFCDGCPVRRPCHIAASRSGVEYGIWAGKVWNVVATDEDGLAA